MEVDNPLRTISLQLYQFLCQHVVGTEKTVRTKRLLNTKEDILESSDDYIRITSGSGGEGLDLKGSDLDLMFVVKIFAIQDDIENVKLEPKTIHLVMEMNDTTPGFTLLRISNLHDSMEVCLQKGNSNYFSSMLFKLLLLTIMNKGGSTVIIHGPCLSDHNGLSDLAFCLHYPHWIQPVENWLSRGHTSWPSSDVKSDIIDHGVLFVPIGSKGSVNEALEWRISFSVAEKLLIYSFSHTQLLCYALMKILLKDLINSNINCKDLLCSYFIKTIIFWVSEETPETEWKPENLIQCFMSCFRRLLYCVEYSMCPHYFIPIINMFENKIVAQARKLLLGHLNTLFCFGWRCVLFSELFQNFTINLHVLPNRSEIQGTQLGLILTSYSLYSMDTVFKSTAQMWQRYRKCIRMLNVNKSSVIKLLFLRSMSVTCSNIQQSIDFSPEMNKTIYTQRQTQLAYLLQSIYHDALSGLFMLASFFYKTKQYRVALYILSYALMKCTPEKAYYKTQISLLTQNVTKSKTMQRLGILRVIKLLDVNSIVFKEGSTLIPQELAFNCVKTCDYPPVVFAHFLCFLCHYHLNDMQQCNNSIRDIERTIDENVGIANIKDAAQGHLLLGVALQFVGQADLATRAFICSHLFQLKRKRFKNN